ncbi:MAG: hypothetical protein ACR2RA_18975 [Geminicoccaceae bacterium]
MTFSKDLVRGAPAQAVAPDDNAQMGGTGASLTVPSSAVANSDAAPKGGIVLVTIPAGSAGNIRIGDTVVATANDQLYPGGDVYSFPIEAGWRVSIFGDAGGFTASVSMAQ